MVRPRALFRAAWLAPVLAARLGEALAAASRKAEAGQRFQVALAALPATAASPAQLRQRARALRRLRRTDEAAAQLDALLAASPGQAGLRADLILLRLDENP